MNAFAFGIFGILIGVMSLWTSWRCSQDEIYADCRFYGGLGAVSTVGGFAALVASIP